MVEKEPDPKEIVAKAKLDPAYATKIFREYGERLDLCPAERYVNQQGRKAAKNRGIPVARSFQIPWEPEGGWPKKEE